MANTIQNSAKYFFSKNGFIVFFFFVYMYLFSELYLFKNYIFTKYQTIFFKCVLFGPMKFLVGLNRAI
jgi:hypothetical protein